MVANVAQLSESKTEIDRLRHLFAVQKKSFNADPYPPARVRRARLRRLRKAVIAHKDEVAAAVAADFGDRAHQETVTAEILTTVEALRYVASRLRRWMKPSQRDVGWLMFTTSARVHYQPLGVVGIVAPWNYPFMLVMRPLAYAIAAGNRVMVKPSEYTPNTAAILKKVLGEVFEEDEVAVIEGDATVAAEFSTQPFDHLLFTGSTQVGRTVMRAAAENLTPVTLELGGKSPTLIGDTNLAMAAERICYAKCMNAGQTCVAPDYVLIPRDKLDAFSEELKKAFAKLYPHPVGHRDYTSVVNERQYQRLNDYLADAEQKGATVIHCSPGEGTFEQGTRKMPLQIVTNVTDDMLLMQNEIFGPILPLIPYDEFDAAIDYINQRERPLALNLFERSGARRQRVLNRTHSGGVCVNDAVFHAAIDDMPFGGVGASGMGRYHGPEGFERFSNGKGVLVRPAFMNTARNIFPPYGGWVQRLINRLALR